MSPQLIGIYDAQFMGLIPVDASGAVRHAADRTSISAHRLCARRDDVEQREGDGDHEDDRHPIREVP